MRAAERTAALLHLVGEVVGGLTDRDLQALLDGRMRLAVVPAGDVEDASPSPATQRPARSAQRAPSAAGLAPDEAQALVSEIRSASDRADAEAVLGSRRLTKADLVVLAGEAGVVVPKSLTVVKYRAALVERLVGYRLRSEALRGGVPVPTGEFVPR